MDTKALIELDIQRDVDHDTGKYKLDITVLRYENIDSEIFVFQLDVNAMRTFQTVATATHMVDLWKHNPQPGTTFYLENNCHLAFDHVREVLYAESEILRRVQVLVDDWNLVRDTLTKHYTKIIE